MQVSFTNTFQWGLGSLQSGAAHCLSAALIGATILLLALSFRGGIDRGHDTTIVMDPPRFFHAVAASIRKAMNGDGIAIAEVEVECCTKLSSCAFDLEA
jgi:hypothetical protein